MSTVIKQPEAKTCESMEPLTGLLKFRPPRIALVCFAAAALLHFLSPVGAASYFFLRVLALPVFATGFALMMWSWAPYQRTKTPHCQAPATTLIRKAPYTFSRNPMYLGMTLQLLGGAFLLGSVIALVAPLAFFIIMNGVFIPYEERSLLRTFGESYADYRRRVRRWL